MSQLTKTSYWWKEIIRLRVSYFLTFDCTLCLTSLISDIWPRGSEIWYALSFSNCIVTIQRLEHYITSPPALMKHLKATSLNEAKKFHRFLFWYCCRLLPLFPQLNNFCVIIKKSVSAKHVLSPGLGWARYPDIKLAQLCSIAQKSFKP